MEGGETKTEMENERDSQAGEDRNSVRDRHRHRQLAHTHTDIIIDNNRDIEKEKLTKPGYRLIKDALKQ